MKKTIKEQLDDVQEQIFEHNNSNNFLLRYTEEGFVSAITLVIYQFGMDIEVQLWNSENEEREWIEECNDYEYFKTFLQRKVSDCLHSFTELKSILNCTMVEK